MIDDNLLLEMKRGDTMPALVCTLTDNGEPIDLTPAVAVRVLLKRLPSRDLVVNREVTGTSAGVVTMNWEPADTATARSLDGEVEVTWPGGKVQTFPAVGAFRVEIRADLG